MVRINGKELRSKPWCCDECPFFISFGMIGEGRQSQRGSCTLFDKTKNAYADLSKRCDQLFEKAFLFPEGTDLVIVER